MGVLLTLDPSSQTGWTMFDGHLITSGVQKFERRRGESPGVRFLKFRGWLRKMNKIAADLHDDGLTILAYEQPIHRGGAPTEVLLGFVTEIKTFCAQHEIQFMNVQVGTLKKFATGDGRADKPEMVKAARKRFNRPDLEDDNEADALHVLDWMCSEIGIDLPTNGN